MIVDPHNITNFKRTDAELQAFLMFCPAVAGKTAVVISKKLNEFITLAKKFHGGNTPFEALCGLRDKGGITALISEVGLGKNNLLTRTYTQMADRHEKGFNLRTCTPADLEEIDGIGMKTSRFFILHSREKQNVAVLDTHILRHLRDNGYDAPHQTPSNPKKYAELEKIVLSMAKKARKSYAEFDLWVWRKYTKTTPISA